MKAYIDKIFKFSSLFQTKSQTLLGVDISSSAIKIVELSKRGEKYTIENYSIEALPLDAVTEKNISDVEAVGETISKAIKRARIKLSNIALAVPVSAVITKVVQMPADLTDNDLETQIMVEADQYIPYSMEEVNLDFEIVGPNENSPEHIDVLLAASRSENVDIRVAAADLGGLNTKVVDVETYTMEHVFPLISSQLPNSGKDMIVALFDMGATITTLTVVKDGEVIYTRDATFGGRQLTQEVQRRFGLSFDEAEMAKKQGGLPDNYNSEALEPFLDSSLQQINRSLQFFFSSSEYETVDHILLAGGNTSIAGFDQKTEERLGITTSIANPFADMSTSSKIKDKALIGDASSLLIACGLALRSFN